VLLIWKYSRWFENLSRWISKRSMAVGSIFIGWHRNMFWFSTSVATSVPYLFINFFIHLFVHRSSYLLLFTVKLQIEAVKRRAPNIGRGQKSFVIIEAGPRIWHYISGTISTSSQMTQAESYFYYNQSPSSIYLHYNRTKITGWFPVLPKQLRQPSAPSSLGTATDSSPLLALSSHQFHSKLKTFLFEHSFPP